MSKKQSKAAPTGSRAVTLERARRLYRLLQLLAAGPKTRGVILKRLKIDIRTFYRDLELLRDCSVTVNLSKSRYSLSGTVAKASPRLPFPDPNLTLGEASILAKGRNPVHKKLRKLVQHIVR